MERYFKTTKGMVVERREIIEAGQIVLGLRVDASNDLELDRFILLHCPGIETELVNPTVEELAMLENGKVKAIHKYFNDNKGVTLREARDYVENIIKERNESNGSNSN